MPGSGGAVDGTQLYTVKHTYTQTGITDLKAFTFIDRKSNLLEFVNMWLNWLCAVKVNLHIKMHLHVHKL